MANDESGRHTRTISTAGTVAWALVPAVTLGFGTAPVMIHAATRTLSRLQALAAAVYVATTCVLLAVDPDDSVSEERIFGLCMIVNLFLGTVHAFAIRPWVWGDRTGRSRRRQTLRERQRAALSSHKDRLSARRTALDIVASDPLEALELRIGRPDLGVRAFPDGGLVDVNNVPASTLARTTGLSKSTAEEIVRTRGAVGGFSSAADLSVTMDLPPEQLDAVSERLVFLPLGGAS